MARFFPFFFFFFVLFFPSKRAAADGLYIQSLGTRALSLGGAFLGLADDWSAVYWNPAGLAFLNPRKNLGISAEGFLPSASYRQEAHVPGGGTSLVLDSLTLKEWVFSGLAAGCAPLGKRWTVGLGVFTPVDFGIDWRSSSMKSVSNDRTDIRWHSRLSVLTIAPALAYQFGERLSAGATLGLNYGVFEFARYAGNFLAPWPEPPFVQPVDLGQYQERLTGWGASATLGILYRPSSRISLGATLAAMSPMNFRGEAKVAGFPALSAVLEREIGGGSRAEKKVSWPVRLGAGIAFRPATGFTVTADIEWIPWSELGDLRTTYGDPNWAVYMGERGNDRMPLFSRNSLKVKAGAEYRFRRFDFRAGFFTDPRTGEANRTNIFFPGRRAWGAAAGSGVRLSGWRLDLGFSYRTTTEPKSDLGSIPVGPPSSGTQWDFSMPGRFDGQGWTASLALSRAF
jgi:long-chain fatty acid transport protein